jgi:hypothetical protein
MRTIRRLVSASHGKVLLFQAKNGFHIRKTFLAIACHFREIPAESSDIFYG